MEKRIQGGLATEQTLSAISSTVSSTLSTGVTASSAVITRVAASATSVTLKASNSARKGIILYNDSNGICCVKYGSTAGTSDFTVKVFPDGHHFIDGPIYSGVIDAIWTSAGVVGAMQVTEL